MGKIKESHSKKGFGNGFISKVERFSSDIDFQGYFIPDPRAYSSSLPSTRDESQTQNSPNKREYHNSSSAFKAVGRAENEKKTLGPGPGAYNIQKPMKRSFSQDKPTAVFKSGVNKLQQVKPMTK